MQPRNISSQTALPQRRRTTAMTVKQRALTLLAESLPQDWISQPLSPVPDYPAGKGATPPGPATAECPSADILVISPRGRCHFLFVRAPADRWWDGELHSVPAEKISAEDAAMARRLRAAGHKARAIWGERDLWRALRSWGCPVTRPPGGATGAGMTPSSRAAAPHRSRPVLHLGPR